MSSVNLACVVGARPNFVKMAPLLKALGRYPNVRTTVVHTGQHYDHDLSDVFFRDLGMRAPDIFLGVGSGTHAAQTGRIMERIEEVFAAGDPSGKPFDRVVVVGDVNSTMATALVAAKLQIPIAHIEAGLRSFDRSMPEEINRIVTDTLSDLLFVTEPAAVENLRREGHPEEHVHLVGNIMIDTLVALLPQARQIDLQARFGVQPNQYGVITLHRPSNVDDPLRLRRILEVLVDIAQSLPMIFPMHPRTRHRLEMLGLECSFSQRNGLCITHPLGYIDFIALTSQAKLIVTDSGGLAQEATALGVPCLTVRPNTESPITVYQGTNTLVGDDLNKLYHAFHLVMDGKYKRGTCPALWDGRTAQRIAKVLTAAHGAGCSSESGNVEEQQS